MRSWSNPEKKSLETLQYFSVLKDFLEWCKHEEFNNSTHFSPSPGGKHLHHCREASRLQRGFEPAKSQAGAKLHLMHAQRQQNNEEQFFRLCES